MAFYKVLKTAVILAALSQPSIGAPLAPSAPQDHQVDPERLQVLHQFIEQKTEGKQIAGAVAVVARQGKLVDFQSYGYLDIEKQVPMPKDAIFRMYSMSKPVTAVAFLTLVERGLVRLDDPVAKYLPEFGEPKVVVSGNLADPKLEPAQRPLTIRHLLTHTSGITYSAEGGTLAEQLSAHKKVGSVSTLAEFSRAVASVPLANHPGERFQYGFSHDILGRVIEVVSGVEFATFVEQQIFEPLAMHDSGFSVPADKRHRLVPVHTSPNPGELSIANDNPSPNGESILAFPAGGEGLYSTAADYLRFAQMLHNGGTLDGAKILAGTTVAMMMSNQLLGTEAGRIPDSELGYGLGLGIRLDLSKGELGTMGQYGWGGYATTDYMADRELDFIWIYLSQHLPPDQNDVIRSLRNLVYQSMNEI